MNDFKEKNYLMSSKYIVFITALSVALISCGRGVPEVNSTNCSGAGMQAVLPTFGNEAERQAFIDKCQSVAEK
ncbi:entry exclusion lipoprotein TrbK [Nitrosovibrio tenuis]|uniref:entry exclusion lipoprotein TrbK n=1 Tax=Nitrosovibrio tenuis TaxID=1233 RepID=UPI001FDF19D9|nr:entry exclusion lipoprotein TrbK [Nitrosovibrio tenuis]